MTRKYVPVEKITKPCEWCGLEMTGNAKRQYCSVACRQAAHRGDTPLAAPRPTLRFQVMKRDNFKCRYCGRGVEDGVKLTVDHVVPKSAGGISSLNNLRTACYECNAGKGNQIL